MRCGDVQGVNAMIYVHTYCTAALSMVDWLLQKLYGYLLRWCALGLATKDE